MKEDFFFLVHEGLRVGRVKGDIFSEKEILKLSRGKRRAWSLPGNAWSSFLGSWVIGKGAGVLVRNPSSLK